GRMVQLVARFGNVGFGGRDVRFSTVRLARKSADAEAVQGFDGKRDSGGGHFQRGRGRAHLWRICRRAARVLSGNGGNVRRDARGGGRAPRPAAGVVPAAFWGSHPTDPARRRARLSDAAASVDDAAAGREGGATAGGNHGDGGEPVLHAGG